MPARENKKTISSTGSQNEGNQGTLPSSFGDFLIPLSNVDCDMCNYQPQGRLVPTSRAVGWKMFSRGFFQFQYADSITSTYDFVDCYDSRGPCPVVGNND